MIRGSLALAGVAVLVGTTSLRHAPPPVIGVLEQPPQCSKTRSIGVRPVFARRGASWIPLIGRDSLRGIDLKAQQFTLAFDGKSLGTLNTTDAEFAGDDWTFRRDHLLDVTPGQTIPAIANRSHRFHGWCNAPAIRPIVAVTSGNYADPESWKAFQPSRAVIDSLFPAFQKAVGKATNCRHTVSARGDSSEHEVVYRYTARDLVAVAAYRNNGGREIVSLRLRDGIRPCDYWMDPQMLDHWFLVATVPKSLGDEMDLVDAGDYDGDGKSELLFWATGDDVDEYILMYDDFAKQAEFYWNYH